MDHFNELLGRTASRFFAGVRIDEVIPDVVLEYHCEQPIHRSPATRYSLKDICTAMLFIERALDGLDLALDATDSVEKLLFLLNCVAHE